MSDLFSRMEPHPAGQEREPATLAELYDLMASAEPPGPGVGRFVPGEGPEGAPILFVGEQPGDQEDVQGKPFVGPAGQLLDRALADAGVPRGEAYVTNAVKRFHFTQRGKRRIHEKPSTGEIRKERWWLDKEIRLVKPRIVVALGATAVQALAGKALPITRSRGPYRWPDERDGYITVHPSYLLRLQDADERRTAYEAFVGDLQRIGEIAGA
ncbi:UdgX family uracil-DNA binding protein [Alsobacter sp. SYSU BS001988]|jgi:DNA polymerase